MRLLALPKVPLQRWSGIRVAASVPCPTVAKTAVALDRYLRVRARHKDAHLPWPWLGKRGRLTAGGIQQLLRRRATKLACQDCIPISSATGSPTPGSPRVGVRPT